jgi:hypothetical protein
LGLQPKAENIKDFKQSFGFVFLITFVINAGKTCIELVQRFGLETRISGHKKPGLL